MGVALKNKIYQSSVAANESQKLRDEADAVERQLILRELKSAVDSYPDDHTVDWDDYELELQVGSSLHEVHMPGSILLKDLLKTVTAQSMFTQENIKNRDVVCVSSTGRMEVFGGTGWIDVAGYFRFNEAHRSLLAVLADIAEQAGGWVLSVSTVGVEQWLKFHDLDTPKDVLQVRNLIEFLTTELPEVDDLGNFFEQISGNSDGAVSLSAEHVKTIRGLTGEFVPYKGKLLDRLYEEGKTLLPRTINWGNADQSIKLLLSGNSSKSYAKRYIESLEWYGANPEQTLSAEHLEQMLVTAILLDLDPHIGENRPRNHVGGYDFYRADFIDSSRDSIRQDFENFLVAKTWVCRDAVQLASHLLLASTAPEFLVKDVPRTLLMGSIGWVTFCRAVVLVEASTPGACRVMTYAQVMKFAQIDPVSPSLAQLHGFAAINPIVDWAVLNQVITHQSLARNEKGAFETAILAYQSHIEALAKVSSAFSAALPNRKTLALQSLKDAVPSCDFLEDQVLKPIVGSVAPIPDMSIVDLHISNDLAGKKWDLPKAPSIYKTYPQLCSLESNQVRFENDLELHYKNLNDAFVINLRLIMSQMPAADRDIFHRNPVTVFTLRPSVAVSQPTSAGSVGMVGVNTAPPVLKESQQDKDLVTGRYGVVICATQGNNILACYELFTLRGECRKNVKLGELISKSGKMGSNSRLDFSGSLRELTPAITPTWRLPVDIRCYTHGIEFSENVFSTAVIEKLGVVPGPPKVVQAKPGTYQSFLNPHLDTIATFIVTHRPLTTYDELKEVATQRTWLEQNRKDGAETLNYVANLVIPFKQCIEDLCSGERDRVIDGVYGCLMDGIALAATIVGATTKVLNIAAKTISTASKIARLAKFGLGMTVSIFNPADGVPTFIAGVAKPLLTRGFRLGVAGMQMVDTAMLQLHKLTGKAKSVDLIRLANSPQLGQGRWRPRGSISEVVTVCAVRSNDHWYATSRLGKPWGERLIGFEFQHAFRLPSPAKTLPESFASLFLRQSLPVARTKIDNAISALASSTLNLQTNLSIGLLLGSTPEVRDRLITFLKLVKTDFGGFSGSGFLLETLKESSGLAAFDPVAYKEWKSAGMSAATVKPFMSFNVRNLNEYFHSERFNLAVIADELIHEMFRGAPAATVLTQANAPLVKTKNNQQQNVAPLLNLASGHHPASIDGSTGGVYDRAKALENAHSLALVTSLLSQLITDSTTYLENVVAMESALRTNRNGRIDGEVLLNLNVS